MTHNTSNRLKRYIAFLLTVAMVMTSVPVNVFAEEAAAETQAVETQAPETQAPETQAPETQAPETQAPETQAPETQAPETQAAETQAPETQVTETQAPETQVTEAQASETQVTEAQASETQVTEAQAPETQVTETQESETKESETETETEETELSYEYTSNDGTVVELHAEKGVFPAETKVTVKAVSKEDAQAILDAGFEKADSTYGTVDAAMFDITFTDKDGNKVQPDGKVTIKIKNVNLDIEGYEKNVSYKMYRVNDDGTLKNLNGSMGLNKKTAKFENDHFTNVAVAAVADLEKVLEDQVMTLDGESGDQTQINLVDINAITASQFLVKPKGETGYKELPLPEGTVVHVGDEVKIKFAYTQIKNASADAIYFFNIPDGLNAIASQSRGDILDNGAKVGTYGVNNGRVELTFNQDYLDQHDNTIDAGDVLFYATLDESALKNNGEIKLGDTVIGKVPIVKDTEVTNTTVKKWNGDGTVDGSGLVYDAKKGAVQYTIEVKASDKNNKVIDSIDVTDTLTTTVNGEEDTSIVTGDYTDIVTTPSSATFTKKNGKYVLHADNVKAGDTIKVTYWVPVKAGIVQANFTNDVDATKKVGGTESMAGSDSVQGKINNTLQINKSAENPVYHVDEATKTTTVTYKVRVTAPASNTTDIANAYVEDIYELGGDLVTGISGFSTTSENVSYNNDFETGDKPKFTVELGTMKPGDTKEFTYTAVLDTDKCYMQNSSGRWLDNRAYAKSGDFTFDNSKGSRYFKKEFTKKTGIFDPISGAYKFTVVFNGVLPDTPENADLTDPKYYYDGVLDFLDDEIQTKGKGFHYVGTPAPVLEAYRGPEGSAALQTATLDGNSIDGQESFHLAVPQNMKGAYSYRLTYYVNLPADAQQTDVVKNQYSVTLKGIGNGGSDQTFNSSASVSSASAGSNALNKDLSNETGAREVLETETGHESEYATQMYTVKISSPIAANATLEDTVTDGDIFGIDFPSDYLQQNLVIKQGNKVLENGTDYTLESIDNKSFKVTFLKAVTDASTTNPVTVTYKGQLKVTDAGKEFAETPNNVNNLNPSKIKNSATLNNGNLGPVTKSVDLEPTGKIVKKAANAQELGGAGNELAWDIKPSFDWVYCAFGLGYHNLVDTIPADQELVKVEHFTDNDTPQPCPEGADNDHGYDVVENADGTTTVTIKASAGRCNHHETYRIWTRIKASALSDQGINPDDFDNYKFTNSAYYEANGAKWTVAADQTVSNHRFSKETEYGATTEDQGGVKFTLKVNTDAAVLNEAGDTITVHDTMNPQLVLKKDSLRINGKTIDQIPGAKLVYEDDSNKFDLILPDKTAFEVTYIAEIDAEQGDSGWLSNEASIDGRIDTVSVDKTETERLQVGAGASSKLAFFFKKTDKDGNLITEGVKFTIAKVTGADTTAEAKDMTAQGDGTFKYRGIEKNSIYVLTETEAPAKYKKTEPIYISFGTPDAQLKAALEAKGITIQTAQTGGGADLENMFQVINHDAALDIPVEKVWNDQEGDHPEVTVNLIGKVGNDVEVKKSLTLNKDNDWKDAFKGMPANKITKDPDTGAETSTPISYEVTEEKIAGYEAVTTGNSKDGFTVTNTPTTIEIPVEKKWEDNNNPNRPDRITVELTGTVDDANQGTEPGDGGDEGLDIEALDDGNEHATLELTKENGWEGKFTNLPTHKTVVEADGTVVRKPIKYSVNEVAVDGYTTTINGDAENGFTVTNTRDNPASATLKLEGTKTLEGLEILADQFQFTLSADSENPADGAVLPANTTVNVKAGGAFAFDDITFNKVGTYTFSISEKTDTKDEITYDTTPVKVVVEVTHDTVNNKLVVGIPSYIKGNDAATAINFKNIYTPETTSVKVTKKWDDNSNQDGVRPESVTITLYADGNATDKTVTLTADNKVGNDVNTWEYTFTNLQKNKTKANADTPTEEIKYTVKETISGDDYTTSYSDDGLTVTNSHKPGEKTISGEKIWHDANNADNKRPTSIFVQLYKKVGENGIVTAVTNQIQEVTANEQGKWEYSFANLPEKENGQTITYSVKELKADKSEIGEDNKLDENYTVSYEDGKIINTYASEKISINVTKSWDDNNNQDGKRTASVTVRLFANDEAAERVADDGSTTLVADLVLTGDNWTGSFTDLPKNKNGQAITYTVKELTKDGSAVVGTDNKFDENYSVSYSGSQTEGFTVKNSHTPETVEINGQKTWDDASDQDGKRPTSIHVKVMNGDKVAAEQDVEGTGDTWSYSFTNLPKYENGNEITYTISEQAVTGYTTTYNENDITNSYTPGQVSVTVTKNWVDNNNQDGMRKDVIMQLMADYDDGKGVVKVDGKTLTLSDNNLQGTFTGLPEKKNKKTIKYSVKEMKADGSDVVGDDNKFDDNYNVSYSGDMENGFVVTNTHEVLKTSVTVSKVWEDRDNKEGKRDPYIKDGITINLIANGDTENPVATEIVKPNDDGDWSYTFNELDQRKNGNDIVYTVEEVQSEKDKTVYEATVSGTQADGYVVTNSEVTRKVFISKTDDNGNELAGATVEIWEDGAAEAMVGWDTTTEKHELQLKPGKYILKETKAPAGYVKAADIPFTVNEDGTIDIGTGDDKNVVTMVDKFTENKMIFSKVDVGGAYLPGAEIEITGTEASGKEITPITWTTAEEDPTKNPHEFTLPMGEYTFKEVNAPAGYVAITEVNFKVDAAGKVTITDAHSNAVEVKEDGTVVFTDQFVENPVKISKVDIAGTELPGAEIKITGTNAAGVDITPIEWTSTDTPHDITLPMGEYTFEEVNAPNGYEAITKVIFTVDAAGKVEIKEANSNAVEVKEDGTVVFTDIFTMHDMTFSKVDIAGKELPGAEIEITGKNAAGLDIEPITWTSSENPYKFTLAMGNYTFKEVNAPAGYVAITEVNFEVDAFGKVTITDAHGNAVEVKEDGSVVFTDQFVENPVKISKVDIAGTELPGAKIEITGKNAAGLDIKPITWTSTNTPHDITLPMGEYTFKEVNAPAGYVAITEVNFTVDAAGKVTITDAHGNTAEVAKDGTVVFTDLLKLYEVKVVKVDEEDKALEGAELEISGTDSLGQTVETISWTSSSKAETITLPMGKYVLKETATPDDSKYQLAADIEFTIDASGTVKVITETETVDNGKDNTIKMIDKSVPQKETEKGTKPGKPAKPGKGTKPVKTGDTTNMFMWISLLAISVFAITALILYRRRRRSAK